MPATLERPAQPSPTRAPDPPASLLPAAQPPDRLGWLWSARTVAGLAILSTTAGLLFWALVPVVFGWKAALVVSGSMAPAVRPGDIVVVAPLPTARWANANGMIVLVDDPAVPGALLLHRAVGHTPDGALITKGDANLENDRAAVPLADVHGAARLRVPYAGLPVLWLRTGQTVPLVALAFALFVLAWPQRRQQPVTAGSPTPQPGRHRA